MGRMSSKPGTYAASVLLARRLVERGVRVVQILHRGWDQHGNLPRDLRSQCEDTDQPTAALLTDLKRRGLLDKTVVVWGGEFGRTVYSQGTLTADNYGRDHHPRNFCMWLAGGGIKGGQVYGETDDFSYNVVENPVHVNDFNATMLHCLGNRPRAIHRQVSGPRPATHRCREPAAGSGTAGQLNATQLDRRTRRSTYLTGIR